MKRAAWHILVILLAATTGFAQQGPDRDFQFANPNPAYPAAEGPRVCLDTAHGNFNSSERNPGGYAPFLELLRGDGYRVREAGEEFTAEALAECDLMVVADATAKENLRDWAFPHPSAFTRGEMEALYEWIRKGGALLLIADHAPTLGAAADMGAILGVVMLDGYATLRPGPSPNVFSRQSGEVENHVILRGRNEGEQVDTVASFIGHPFKASRDWLPLLKFGEESTAYVHLGFNFPDLPRDHWPRFSVDGWLHAAARRLGKGRVVLLGEVSICTALRVGEEGRPVGMNHPAASQNPQFCLNTVRWLTGVLDPPSTTTKENPADSR